MCPTAEPRQDTYFALAQQCAAKANQLALPNREIFAAFGHRRLELQSLLLYVIRWSREKSTIPSLHAQSALAPKRGYTKMAETQGVPQGSVVVLVEGIEVGPDGALQPMSYGDKAGAPQSFKAHGRRLGSRLAYIPSTGSGLAG
jgi:hypothetical protein